MRQRESQSDRVVGRRRRPGFVAVAVAAATALIAGLTASSGPASAALAAVPGVLVAGAVNTAAGTVGTSPTLPRGSVWLPDTSGFGGHWWVGDQLNGLCRLDPAANTVNNGPWVLGACNASAKSGGQIVAGAVPGDATAMYLYVADAGSQSNKVVRYKILGVNTANPSFGASLIMTVTNLTQKGGGSTGQGRPTALAVFTNPAAPTQQDLLVSYVKSGDVMRVANVNNTTSSTPTVTQIGSTSDGIGVHAFARVGNDLYISEIGGLGGISKIIDPVGATGRPACTTASLCTAVPTRVGPGFPGGLAYDGGRFLYVGDAAKGGASNNIYRLDLNASPVVSEVLSSSVPAFSALDSNQVRTTFVSYTFPITLALGGNPAGSELVVGGDSQLLAAVVTNQQGHFWKIPVPAAPPLVTLLSPNNGPNVGGTVVTITGSSFSIVPGAMTVTFGSSAPVAAACASSTSCTVTSPSGSGTVDVVVTVAGQSSATGNATKFTFNAPPLGPAVTSISPTFGSANGGDVVTISGTNLISGGPTSVSFTPTAGGPAVPATAVNCSNTACTATSPAGAGSADITVTTGAGTSAIVPADVFAYRPVVSSIDVVSGPSAGGTAVTVTGVGFSGGAVTFGGVVAAGAPCGPATCSVTTPAGAGTVDVAVTVGTQTGVLPAAFAYVAAPVGPQIVSLDITSGSTAGGTVVTVSGTKLAAPGGASPSTFTVGASAASFVACSSATTCTFDTPATATAGPVSVVATDVNGLVSNPAQFTYVAAQASLYAWGITAPKGGATWLQGALGGHWWSSDHAQGFCRQDPVGGGRFALNYSVCGDDLVGSAGQGVYDPRPIPGNPNLRYVYVPDNAVKSTAVWRLTFNTTTETMVADPLDGTTMATAMIPLADVRTLKPNGMALGPRDAAGVVCGAPGSNCTAAQTAAVGLYVTDLTDPYVRVVINPEGDPRTQTVGVVAATGDGRGANGTAGFIGNNLYVSGNRATQFFDVTLCPSRGAAVPPAVAVCGMASVPSPAGVFVAGTATDPVRKLVYQSNSPGGVAASVLRYDASHDVYVPFVYGDPGVSVDNNGVVHCEAGGFNGNAGVGCILGPRAGNFLNGGTLPGTVGDNVIVATGPTGSGIGATRPWDTANHPTTAARFSFAFGLAVGSLSQLIITEDPSAGARSGRGTMWNVPFVG